MTRYALMANATYLGTFAYGSSIAAKNGALAIARRRGIALPVINVLPVVEVVA